MVAGLAGICNTITLAFGTLPLGRSNSYPNFLAHPGLDYASAGLNGRSILLSESLSTRLIATHLAVCIGKVIMHYVLFINSRTSFKSGGYCHNSCLSGNASAKSNQYNNAHSLS